MKVILEWSIESLADTIQWKLNGDAYSGHWSTLIKLYKTNFPEFKERVDTTLFRYFNHLGYHKGDKIIMTSEDYEKLYLFLKEEREKEIENKYFCMNI